MIRSLSFAHATSQDNLRSGLIDSSLDHFYLHVYAPQTHVRMKRKGLMVPVNDLVLRRQS